MSLEIKGLAALREHLLRLRPEEVMARALAEQAERMAAAVQDALSEPTDTGEHDLPWLRSGALRDSVVAQANGLQAVVGSSDPAAVPQEMGTSHMPPRPFLASIASSMGEEIARTIGAKVAAALRGDTDDDFSRQHAGSTGRDQYGPHTAPRHATLAKTAQLQSGPRIILARGVASDLEDLGGGPPRLLRTKKGATRFIFPNGMILRFDLLPGQYLDGQVPHINLEFGGMNLHIEVK